jgi:hypothetical protein
MMSLRSSTFPFAAPHPPPLPLRRPPVPAAVALVYTRRTDLHASHWFTRVALVCTRRTGLHASHWFTRVALVYTCRTGLHASHLFTRVELVYTGLVQTVALINICITIGASLMPVRVLDHQILAAAAQHWTII